MGCELTSRRALLGGAGAVLAAGVAPARAAGFCRDPSDRRAETGFSGSPLGTLDADRLWGVALESPALDDPTLLEALAAEKPRFLAIASGFKFGDLYRSEAQCLGTAGATWAEADNVVAVANRLGVPYRGDAMAWNDWLPPWITEIALARPPGWRNRLRRCFEHQFTDIFGHVAALDRTPGASRMRWCGLVNEPFNPWLPNDGVAAWRPGAWLDAYGTDADGMPGYIGAAFDLGARSRLSSDVALFVNEANCENDHFGPLLRPAMLKLVDALQRGGRRVDAVGLECHLMPQWMHDPDRPDWSPFVAFLRDLSRRGVKILLTELDVNDCSLRDEARRDALVARTLRSFVEAALSVPGVEMITNWDFSDRYAWLRGDAVRASLGTWAGCVPDPPCPRPDLYDEQMRPKPARQALAEALRRARR